MLNIEKHAELGEEGKNKMVGFQLFHCILREKKQQKQLEKATLVNGLVIPLLQKAQ